MMMDRELLKRRIEHITESVLVCWEQFEQFSDEGGVAPMLRAKYGEYIIVVGVEFAQLDEAA